MKGDRICYPWDLKKFKWSKYQLSLIMDNLSRVGYNVSAYQTKPKDELVRRYTRKIVEILITHFNDMERDGTSDENPWIMLVCPNASILQTLATTIPTTMALSTKLSCFTLSTRKMIELFIAQRGEAAGGFEFDTADKVVEEVAQTGLMVWSDLGTKTAGALKFESGFHELLVARMESERKTIFMYHSPAISKNKIGHHEAGTIAGLLRANFGENIGSIIVRQSDMIYLPATLPKPTVRNF